MSFAVAHQPELEMSPYPHGLCFSLLLLHALESAPG